MAAAGNFRIKNYKIIALQNYSIATLFPPGFQINTKNERYIVFALINPWKWKKRLNKLTKDLSTNKI